MSLVGSLEDLGLGDLLQIVSLSRKSGLLVLRSGKGEGQILFHEGAIRAAVCKDGPADLLELLAASGEVAKEALEAAAGEARRGGRELAALLVEQERIDAERLDALLRDHVDRTVLGMFSWPSGEFSFEVSDVEPELASDLRIDPGINPQFLALEGTRLRDEGGIEDDIDENEISFSGEEPSDPVEASVAAPADPGETTAPVRPSVSGPPVIAIDPELRVLEWVKAALAEQHARVHIFQRPELGLNRIRQYLARAEVPLVLLASDAPPDPLSGARNARELARRLKDQSARMPVALLVPSDREAAPSPPCDAVVHKPLPGELADPRAAGRRERLGRALAEGLARCLEPEPANADEPDARGLDAAARTALRHIESAASSHDALRVVLDAVGQAFSRAALFAIEGEVLGGVGQRGLPRAGGPDDDDFCEVRLACGEAPALRTALEADGARCARLGEPGDHRLAVLLGNAIPEEAWLAPLREAPEAPPFALLYADNLPGGELIGDLGCLEALLLAASAPLARALRERG